MNKTALRFHQENCIFLRRINQLTLVPPLKKGARGIFSLTRKARPQCPHKAGKRARTCSQSLGASDYPSRRYVGADSAAPRSMTVVRLPRPSPLGNLAPFVQPPASSLRFSACRLLTAVPPKAGLRLSLSALSVRLFGGLCPFRQSLIFPVSFSSATGCRHSACRRFFSSHCLKV